MPSAQPALSAATARSRFGTLLLVEDAGCIRALALGDDARSLLAAWRGAALSTAPDRASAAAQWLDAVVAHIERPHDPPPRPPLAPGGTPFQKAVWDALRAIPPGETRGYGQLAAALGRPGAARAVARACAANPIALLIPCHRVVRGDGRPGGYRWGVHRKLELLHWEGARADPDASRRAPVRG